MMIMVFFVMLIVVLAMLFMVVFIFMMIMVPVSRELKKIIAFKRYHRDEKLKKYSGYY
jgi:cytochrome oxidase Cu insertion factor (SCO1/SenC/PrrC family)